MSGELLSEVHSLRTRITSLEGNERKNMIMLNEMSVKQDLVLEKISEMKDDVKEDIKEMKDGAVLKVEFQPIQKWVNTIVYVIVGSVFAAILSLVIVKIK